jgi:hypothetical protein
MNCRGWHFYFYAGYNNCKTCKKQHGTVDIKKLLEYIGNKGRIYLLET